MNFYFYYYFHSKLSIKFIILELLVEIKKKESRVQQQLTTAMSFGCIYMLNGVSFWRVKKLF